MDRKRVVVFDFDGTLTREDTLISFSRFALGPIKFAIGVLRALPWLVAWKMGIITGSRAKEKLYSFLYKGLSKREIMEKAHGFAPKFNQKTLSLLRKHLEAGDCVYIISASLDLWLYEIAERLEAKVICTLTSADESGTLDGRFATANCINEEKVRRLKALEKGDFHLIAYGDKPSGGDAALLKAADEFVVIE